MKVKDLKVGDECWFGGNRIRITDIEDKSDRYPFYIEITYDIITDIFNFGRWSFYVFWRSDFDRDIESYKGGHVDNEVDDNDNDNDDE